MLVLDISLFFLQQTDKEGTEKAQYVTEWRKIQVTVVSLHEDKFTFS